MKEYHDKEATDDGIRFGDLGALFKGGEDRIFGKLVKVKELSGVNASNET